MLETIREPQDKKEESRMSEQTKHESFVSEETLEQISTLIEPLSNYLGISMTLLDANGGIIRRSVNPSPCSLVVKNDGSQGAICAECYKRLGARLRTIYDTPIMEKCSAGVEIIVIPIKTERQYLTSTKKHFMGMLCLNSPICPDNMEDMQVEQTEIYNMITFLEYLLRQIAMRNEDLGELVSQLLDFQNELTMSYRFSNAVTDNMHIDLLFHEALELIQGHVRPKEACVVVPSSSGEFREVAHSIATSVLEAETSLSNIVIRRIVINALQGNPVLINSYNEHSRPKDLDDSIKSILAMPIRAGKDVFGAIVLVNKENGDMFLSDDENFVASLTNSLGMVLKHIKLAKEVVKAEKASIERQRELVARVVHKMRNLLVAMQGNVRWVHEIFETKEVDREALESALAGIDRNSRDSSKVVSGFLKYVAPERFQPEYASIPSLVGEVVEDMRKNLEEKNVQIEEEYSQELPQIRVDTSVLRSDIRELIGNASEHLNGDGCISVRTGIASDKEVKMADAPVNGQYLTIEVSDNGPGISDDIRSKIFNLGFSTRSMGTGLGLSLVKRDVERHSGRIVEVGTTGADFLILLPVSNEA